MHRPTIEPAAATADLECAVQIVPIDEKILRLLPSASTSGYR
jgi:hypothetical protein